jgi:hypothetical protein
MLADWVLKTVGLAVAGYITSWPVKNWLAVDQVRILAIVIGFVMFHMLWGLTPGGQSMALKTEIVGPRAKFYLRNLFAHVGFTLVFWGVIWAIVAWPSWILGVGYVLYALTALAAVMYLFGR